MDLSSEEILYRKDKLKHFDNYFENVTNALRNFSEKIGWTIDETPTNDELIKCPVNSAHRILPSKLDSHRELCELEQHGYNSTDSIYPSYNCSTPLAQTLKIDEITQMNILKSAHEESNFTLDVKNKARDVSQSIERYVCDFTPDERRVLYDHAVKNTKLSNQDVINDLTSSVDVFNKSNEKPKTEFDILQEQRDLKRRSAAYRGKKVHTDRKSYVEVLREVVEGLTNSLCHQQDKSICTETSSSVTETVPNNRIVYKYEGIRNYGGNPYTRWLDIESEESKLINKSGIKNDSSSYTSQSYSKDTRSSSSELKISKRSKSRSCSRSSSSTSSSSSSSSSSRSRTRSRYRTSSSSKSRSRSKSKSRSRTRSKEQKYTSTGFRNPLKFEHNKSKSPKTRSRSRETMSKESRSQPMSGEYNFKRCRSRTRSKSPEFNSCKKLKSSINYFELLIPNDEKTTIKSKSRDEHKKKKKDKKRKKYLDSPKK